MSEPFVYLYWAASVAFVFWVNGIVAPKEIRQKEAACQCECVLLPDVYGMEALLHDGETLHRYHFLRHEAVVCLRPDEADVSNRVKELRAGLSLPADAKTERSQ